MLILALESSAKTASAALCCDGTLLAQTFINCGLTHSRTLLPIAEDLIRNAGYSMADVDLFAVARGPGSFTGIRIGVSAVKGLAWALDKPACGISTLEAMSWNGLSAPQGAIICPVMDARRGEVYNALFELCDGHPNRICDDRAVSIENLRLEIEKSGRVFWIVGDGAALCYERLSSVTVKAVLAPEHIRYQCAWGVAMAADTKPHIAAQDLNPTYLRMPQAEREYLERNAKNGGA